ncbi:MAG: phage tail sheath C-terminal domain-containing protein [bacterium]|nr:phage tail sheath C-terminal domain-containing protein [bacterium]
MRLFYANGGGICYVVSVGNYTDAISNTALETGISMLEPIDEVTMIVVPDAVSLEIDKLASVQNAALAQCLELKDRVAILDVKDTGNCNTDATNFRNSIGTKGASYGAAYYPYIKSVYDREINVYDIYKGLELSEKELENAKNYAELSEPTEESTLFAKQLMSKPEYAKLVAKIQEQANLLPPSGAIAGIYCANDNQRGVWHAPANMSVSGISDINVRISDKQQGELNEDTSGKCINAIRAFQGKGILVWGARTLDGLSSEWKYISVRRFFNYVEESIQESTAWAVFQPNDANTWVKVRCQIENFLSNLWRDGALAGSTPQEAFYVRVGINQTMTAQDILNGYMIVEIGMAAVRPAEFIVLQFSHKLQES